MFLKSIELTNLLSFGPESEPFKLRPLNILIGPNGSGKSNLIDAIDLLRSTPLSRSSPIFQAREPVSDWIWKGDSNPNASLVGVIDYPQGKTALRHGFSFCEYAQHLKIVHEQIEKDSPRNGRLALPYYRYTLGRPMLRKRGKATPTLFRSLDATRSILAQLKEPDQYPEITYLSEAYDKIHIYNKWSFGRQSRTRQAQGTDVRNDFLNEDGTNLGLILNRLRRESARHTVIDNLNQLYSGIDDFDLIVQGGTAQIFLQEGDRSIPATRLSDGTLRYLSLLAILCHPEPPPLICIEEPELGLHPDAIVAIGELLIEASSRTQLIVTTHSDILVDVMSEVPESVVVFEKADGQTKMQRLDANHLEGWLKESSLGTLWRQGNIGGNRW